MEGEVDVTQKKRSGREREGKVERKMEGQNKKWMEVGEGHRRATRQRERSRVQRKEEDIEGRQRPTR